MSHAGGGTTHEDDDMHNELDDCSPTDWRTYEPNDYSPLQGILAVGPIITFACVAVCGLYWLVSQVSRWLMPVLLLMLISNSVNAADLRVHAFADDDNTFKEVHGETQNVLWAVGKLYFRERVTTPAGGTRWTRWYWIDNMSIDINNESGGAYQVTIETFNGGLTSWNNNSLGWQLAIAGGVSDNNRNLITIENDIQGNSKAYNVQHQPAYYPASNGYVAWRNADVWTAWIELANWYIDRIDE